jgi:hypothetical protein
MKILDIPIINVSNFKGASLLISIISWRNTRHYLFDCIQLDIL